MKLYVLFLFILTNVCSFSQTKGASPINNSQESGVRSQKNTYAVVVGISNYQDPAIPDLRFADKDAEAFANYLRSNAGGKLDNDHLKVLLNKDATAAQFAIALDWLVEVSKEGDRVLIYFSGHGDVEAKRITQPGYLLCWDAPSRVYLAGGALALPMIQDVISTLSVQNKAKVVVITDACRSGKLAGSTVGGSQITGANLAKQYANEIKILSCQPHEYSIEGEQWGGGRGAFSFNLVNALYGMADQNNDLIVNLQEAGRYLEDHVTAEVAPVSQVPMILGNRSESLSKVDASLLASLKSGKSNQQTMLSSIDARGMEEDVLISVDTSVRLTYKLFKKSLKDKIFLEPANQCADSYYEQLIKEPGLKRLHSTMRRNYAAALQDDAQQVLNNLLKIDLKEIMLSKDVKAVKYRTYPQNLGRAAELLGTTHYLYPALQARKFYFEGILFSSQNLDNLDKSLGKQVISKIKECFKWEADFPQAYYLLSRTYAYNLNELDSADYYLEKAVQFAPTWIIPHIYMAFLCINKLNFFDRGRLYLEKAEQMDSNSVMVKNLYGLYYHKQKRYDEAEAYFRRALDIDSSYLWIYNNLGLLYADMGRLDEAEFQILKAIQMDSTHAKLFDNLGFVYRKMQKIEEAEWNHKKAIQIDSNYVGAHLKLCFLYLNNNNFELAEKEGLMALRLDSSHPNNWEVLGNVYNTFKHYHEAERLLKKGIQIDSNWWGLYNNLGNSYIGLGRYDEAEEQYKTGLRHNPKDYYLHYNLAYLKILQNKEDEVYYYLKYFIEDGGPLEWLLNEAIFVDMRKNKDRWNAFIENYSKEKAK